MRYKKYIIIIFIFLLVGVYGLTFLNRPNILNIKVENTEPIDGAIIRVSFANMLGIPLLDVNSSISITNKEGYTNIFFKSVNDNIVLRMYLDSKPSDDCKSIGLNKWECNIPINGSIMATKNTYLDPKTGNQQYAYVETGWYKKRGQKCDNNVQNWCYTNQNFSFILNNSKNNLVTLNPYRIKRYRENITEDKKVLQILNNYSIKFNIPLPILTSIISLEGVCEWDQYNTNLSCNNAQWDNGWTKISFDGGIGAFQPTGGTADNVAILLNTSPDDGQDSLSASFDNNMLAGTIFLDNQFREDDKGDISNWDQALIRYNGQSIYLNEIKERTVPFYEENDTYVEDINLTHRKGYVQLSSLWNTSCEINNGIWKCQ